MQLCSSSKFVFKYQIEAVRFNKEFGKANGRYCSIYWCRFCGFYHLTSRGKDKKKRLR